MEVLIIKVCSMGLGKDQLGMRLNEIFPVCQRLFKKYQTNVCGEGGEFESL